MFDGFDEFDDEIKLSLESMDFSGKFWSNYFKLAYTTPFMFFRKIDVNQNIDTNLIFVTLIGVIMSVMSSLIVGGGLVGLLFSCLFYALGVLIFSGVIYVFRRFMGLNAGFGAILSLATHVIVVISPLYILNIFIPMAGYISTLAFVFGFCLGLMQQFAVKREHAIAVGIALLFISFGIMGSAYKIGTKQHQIISKDVSLLGQSADASTQNSEDCKEIHKGYNSSIREVFVRDGSEFAAKEIRRALLELQKEKAAMLSHPEKYRSPSAEMESRKALLECLEKAIVSARKMYAKGHYSIN